MKKLPDALVIVDPRKEINAIREARKLNIPVIGIVDTNCDPDDVDYPIPANDDAIRSVKLIIGVLNNAIIEATGGEMVDFLTEEDKNKSVKKEEKLIEEMLTAPINKDLEYKMDKENQSKKKRRKLKKKLEVKESPKEEKIENKK